MLLPYPIPAPPPDTNICAPLWAKAVILTAAAAQAQYDYDQCVAGQGPV